MLRAAFLLYGVHHAGGFVESFRCPLCSRKSEARRTAVGRWLERARCLFFCLFQFKPTKALAEQEKTR